MGAQNKAIAGVAKQQYEISTKAAKAAKSNMQRDQLGTRDQVAAEALDPELAQETAVKEVMDQDGLGDNGEELIARPGTVARQYEKLWKGMPMPSPSNPLLDAVARAAVKDPALPPTSMRRTRRSRRSTQVHSLN